MLGRKKYSSAGDEELVLLYRREGNIDLLGELFSRYTHLIFGQCMKYLKNTEDARDATFSLFEKLIKDLRKHDVKQFSHWIGIVCRNHCLSIIREKNSEDSRLKTFSHNSNAADNNEHELMIENEKNLDELNTAITSLPDSQQQCIRMFYLEEKSYQQISDTTGIALNEVKSHIQNGRRNLKIQLTRER